MRCPIPRPIGIARHALIVTRGISTTGEHSNLPKAREWLEIVSLVTARGILNSSLDYAPGVAQPLQHVERGHRRKPPRRKKTYVIGII